MSVKGQILKIREMYDFNDPGMLADINTCKFFCRTAIKHSGTTFELTPISFERIIENKKLGIFVILDNKTITVINHVCYYSNIPMSDRDLYVATETGDRLDTLAYQFYNNASLWWIIASANNIHNAVFGLADGTIIRIPMNIENIISNF